MGIGKLELDAHFAQRNILLCCWQILKTRYKSAKVKSRNFTCCVGWVDYVMILFRQARNSVSGYNSGTYHMHYKCTTGVAARFEDITSKRFSKRTLQSNPPPLAQNCMQFCSGPLSKGLKYSPESSTRYLRKHVLPSNIFSCTDKRGLTLTHGPLPFNQMEARHQLALSSVWHGSNSPAQGAAGV